MADYDLARKATEGQDLTSEKFQKLGKGMNKVCYLINLYKNWVVLAVKDTNTRIIKDMKDELSQLIHLRGKGVLVPDLGTTLKESDKAESYLVKVKEKNINMTGFLQEYIYGIEMSKNEMMNFWGTIDDYTKKDAKKRKTALIDIENILSYMEKENKQIPDFQVKFNQINGHLYVIDPGNENTSGNYLDKQKEALKYWISKLQPPKKLW